MIGIVDYGAGNLKSVLHAFESLGLDVNLCSSPGDLGQYERLVLPGVGAFSWCYNNLAQGGWIEPLSRRVLEEKVPVLGICVGMQLMADFGHEGGRHQGLGWIPGEVIMLEATQAELKIPHIGWNALDQKVAHPVFAKIPDHADVYFVHSYRFRCPDDAYVAATCDYGVSFPAVVARENIVGVQFHPEKSQETGIRLVENFSRWKPSC